MADSAVAENPANAPRLVPGRSCGFCTVCCYATRIDDPELQKPVGVTCAHCTGRGCGIYETRPGTCRTFYCGWWIWPELDEDWRPDRSGVLILPKTDRIPQSFARREGCQFLVLGGEPAILRQGFVEACLRLVSGAIPFFLAVPGPPEFYGAAELMNDALSEAASKKDRSLALAILLGTYRTLTEREFQPAAAGIS